MNKNLVVYTVLTGSKEELQNPFAAIDTSVDRICFTDDPALQSDSWTIRQFDNHSLDSARASRRPKLLPHRYLQDYEWSLYIDNTVRLQEDPAIILEQYQPSGHDFFCFRHPLRACLYDEAEAIIRGGYDDERRVREQIDHYSGEGLPDQNGLIAGSMLLRRHGDRKLIEITEEWYEHVLRYSKRDQLSFNFIRWKHEFTPGYFEGELTQNRHMKWNGFPKQTRVPADFDPVVYSWLNPDLRESGLSAAEHYLKFGRSRKQPYRRHSWQLKKIANKFKSDKGDIYYNAHSYADLYEYFLRDYKDEPLRVLELGLLRHDVQARNPGGPYDDAPSLKMWREYLPKAELFGFDIADFSAAPAMPAAIICRGDMGNTDDLARLIQTSGGKFDVIIDDASHASHHQQIALEFLYAHLKKGGYYFIEDLHFQPPALEKDSVTKTIDVLRALEAGQTIGTPYISEDALKEIKSSAEFLKFYDSADRNFGIIFDDAFAVIKKSGRNKIFDPKAVRNLAKKIRGRTK